MTYQNSGKNIFNFYNSRIYVFDLGKSIRHEDMLIHNHDRLNLACYHSK